MMTTLAMAMVVLTMMVLTMIAMITMVMTMYNCASSDGGDGGGTKQPTHL